MKNTSATTVSHVVSPLQTEEALSKAEVIAWSCALTWEAAFITLGNLFTIVIFAFIKKIRVKKSLYLVINMAFADLAMGSVCLPLSIFIIETRHQLTVERSPFFLKIIIVVFAQVSFITAALISAERFYAIYWPLKHRTLSARAYRLVILTPWMLSILGSIFTVFLLHFVSIVDLYFGLCLYGLSIVLIICGLNIGIWRKFQQKTVPHLQNRALQNQRLTKALMFVSVMALSSWLPIVIYNLADFFECKMSDNIFLVTFFMYFSNSFINPVVYALRIPEFKEALNQCCFTRKKVRRSQGNLKGNEMAADLTLVMHRRTLTIDHNNLQLTFEQEISDNDL